MRILVTGGAGFIGSHLADAFTDRGDEVTIVDDLSAGRAERVPPRAVLHQVSVTEAGPLMEVVGAAGPDLICHLAAQIDVRVSVASPARDSAVNVTGTINVLEAARVTGARVLFCSSGGALYGRDAPIPSNEDVLTLPESPYGVSKYCAEQYVSLYNRLHEASHSVLRLANVYGPRQDMKGEGAVVPAFCMAMSEGKRPTIFGDGTQTRDFVHVSDVVTAFLAAAGQARPGVWNVGSGEEVSVLDLAAAVGKIAGRPADPIFAPPRPGELRRSALSVDRIQRDLSWSAATPLAAGLRTVWDWMASGAADRAPAGARPAEPVL